MVEERARGWAGRAAHVQVEGVSRARNQESGEGKWEEEDAEGRWSTEREGQYL
jgi:hypothetical protein